MSACAALRLRLAAYSDDELDVDAAIEIERHLDACAACRRAVGRQRHLSCALRALHPSDEPPAGFEARVRFATLGATSVTRRVVALGTVIAVLAGAGGWLATSGRTPDVGVGRGAIVSDRADTAPLVTTAAALHERADAHALALDVTSDDARTVSSWLATRLPFAAPIPAPGTPAIAIEGASVVSLGAHPAGLVRYRMNGRKISLFLLAEPAWGSEVTPVRVGTMDFRVFRRRDVDLVGWSHAALSYLLVSEDGLQAGDACAVCHGPDTHSAITDFVAAVAGRASGT